MLVDIETVDDELVVKVGLSIFRLSKGANHGLIIAPKSDDYELTSTKTGSTCTRDKNKIRINTGVKDPE